LPSSNSKRLGSVAYGKKVKLDGEVLKGAKVNPETVRDGDGAIWIKIREPIRGYILYNHGDGGNVGGGEYYSGALRGVGLGGVKSLLLTKGSYLSRIKI